MIGHMKTDGCLTRCPLKGADGDALFAVLCGCGHNIRMILRHLREVFCQLIWLLTRLRQVNDAEMVAARPYYIVRMPA
jgi:transposase, IS5 family